MAQSDVADAAIIEALHRLERRLDRIESRLALPPLDAAGSPAADSRDVAQPPAIRQPEPDLEFVVGQNWLASVGIVVLTCGVGFALLLPMEELPPAAPSLAGGLIAGALLLLARRWRSTFQLVAGYFRGAGMALLYFSALRLCLFGARHALEINSVAAGALLAGVVAANLVVAWRRNAIGLFVIGMLSGFVTIAAIGNPYFVFLGISVLLGLAAYAAIVRGWSWLLVLVIPTAYLTHLLWLLNRPWSGRSLEIVGRPAAGVGFVLAYIVASATASLWRRDRSEEDPATILAVLLNCGAGYGLFVLATMGGAPAAFGPAHVIAAIVFLGIAVAFWRREASRISTFFYAMTGYLALSVALIRLVPVPDVFIWLSGESLIVVATALWFRSKLIVVGNFFIFASIIAAYMAVTASETGISIGFGLVALVTARVLRWQQERLELRTEMMRNAYLATAFFVFPYSLYHLVPRAYVTVAWVGVAVAYYLMNLIVQSPKYRWMGHLTLLFTALYMIVVGIFQLAPAYRIASFLLLGSVLLIVSLVFTTVRARRRDAAPLLRQSRSSS